MALKPVSGALHRSLLEVVEHRKSGLSLNHVIGCPLDCGYCVRHLFGNFEMKEPHLVVDDAEAVRRLTTHWAFIPHRTPLQIFNRATDPLLPGVKDHLFETLERLDALELTNLVLVITRWRIKAEDVQRLDRLRHLRVTILVTWSGIEDSRVEPVESGVAESSMRTLKEHARRTKSIFYWRPLILGFNDTEAHFTKAQALSGLVDATVFTGLYFREEIRAYFRQAGVPDLYPETARRKIFPRELDARVVEATLGRPVFRKTSCGVAFVHGVADYNGHFGVREICDICPKGQVDVCGQAHRRPDDQSVRQAVEHAGLDPSTIIVDDRRIEVGNSSEQQRYYVQHALNYQVHDRTHPHLLHRHGRAEVGWQ